MFKSWSSWLGGEPENEEKTDKPETVEEKNINTETGESQAKGLSGETTLYTHYKTIYISSVEDQIHKHN